MQWPHLATVAMVPPQIKCHTHEYDYNHKTLTEQLLHCNYHSGVGYSPSLSIHDILRWWWHVDNYVHVMSSLAISFL